ncbi:DUF4157 domain-containing protein [Aquimarina sp. AD10]|uniref:eCIS core domain-containing protein n=1 Tax=Aquimarina sp. AD10 TaxID=1714849 RepID=UPI0018F40D20|nr:DUF4157 domain-containing protein [Aquimarina sp. AD10]
MKRRTDKIQEPQTPITPKVTSEPSTGGTAQLMDNRTSTINDRKLQKTMNGSAQGNINPIQRKVNKTGLPDNLKSGIENLSGYSMDDVKVHYNSSKPAQLQAHAYAQGTDIHIGPGQQKHLPHEAWHVVQQKQGRVKPTKQLKSKVNINDDAGLEKEADVMGNRALKNITTNSYKGATTGLVESDISTTVAQRWQPPGLIVLGQNYVVTATFQEIQQWLGGANMWYNLGGAIPWALGGGNAYEHIFANSLTQGDWNYLALDSRIAPTESGAPLTVGERQLVERGHDLDIIVSGADIGGLWAIFPLQDPNHQLICNGYAGGVDFMVGNPAGAGQIVNGIQCLVNPQVGYRSLEEMRSPSNKWWKRGVRANIYRWILDGKPRKTFRKIMMNRNTDEGDRRRDL